MRRNAGVAVHHAAGSEGRRGSYYNASGAGAAASNTSAAVRTTTATTTKDPFLSATADEKVRVCIAVRCPDGVRTVQISVLVWRCHCGPVCATAVYTGRLPTS
jgi:hypothetical protein